MNEATLLADVLAAPDDDAPRLVYADYLQERGELLRGELIVVQCERERLEREDKTTTLEYRRSRWRERALLAEFEGDYRRGFIHRLTMTEDEFRVFQLQSKAPTTALLEEIVLRGQGTLTFDAKKLLASEIPNGRLWTPERGLPRAALVPAVIGVRYSRPTEQTIRDLIYLGPPNLRRLGSVGGLRFTNHAMRQYVETFSYARLEALELWRLTEEEVAFFIAEAPPVKRLTVRDEVLGVFSMSPAFARCPAIPHARELDLTVRYEAEDILRLNSEAFHLESLTLPHGASPEALEELAAGPLTTQLRRLELVVSHGRDVLTAITAPWQRLLDLAIGNATIGMELVNAPALETLVSLRLYGCEMSGDVEAAIRERWPHARLE